MRRVAVLLVLGLAAGCQGATKTPVRPGVDYVVADPRAAFDRIRAGTFDLSAQAARGLAPLVAARTFAAPSDPASFGLDRPQLSLFYLRGGAVVVTIEIGASNFDGHGYYVRRTGDPRVFLVLRDVLVPVFREVGISPAPRQDGS